MQRFTAWISSNSGHDGSAKAAIWTAEEERLAMEEAQQQSVLLLNDEFDEAVSLMSQGSTPFQMLGHSTALFLRATMGGDRAILHDVLNALSRCETVARDYQRRAVADTSGRVFRSAIHPVGTEYALMQAIAQLLFAVACVAAGGSWAQIIKGLLKVRSAQTVISSIRAAEERYIDQQTQQDSLLKAGVDFQTVTTERIDLFIHAAAASSLGLTNMALSFIPVALNRVVSTIGYSGDRKTGMDLLWSASCFSDTIFGGISALVVSSYHSSGVALADIIPKDYPPLKWSRALLQEARQRYPRSRFWMLEQARMAKADRNLEAAVQILSDRSERFVYRQVEALYAFELALNLLFLRRFDEAARCSLDCIALDKWSHGLYYYLAGISYFQLYRAAKDRDRTSEEAQRYAGLARDNLDLVIPNSKQRLVGRRAPWDAFIHEKMNKWRARATSRRCDIVDAIGVSPHQEITYFWHGYRCMQPAQLEASLAELLAFEDSDRNPSFREETLDDLALLAVLKAVCLRQLGRVNEAKAVLERELFVHDPRAIKACPYADEFAWPCGHYEMGCCIWEEVGGEAGDRETLLKCKHHIDICLSSGDFVLGIKFITARNTLEGGGIV